MLLRFGGVVVSSGPRNPPEPPIPVSLSSPARTPAGAVGLSVKLHHHAVAVLGDLDAGEFAEQLRELIGAIAAHVEIRDSA